MAELIVSNSGYETGDIDTGRTLVNDIDEKRAEHINGVVSAVIQIETILGLGPELKGTLVDLVSRLAVAMHPNGTMKLSAPAASVGTGWLDGQTLLGTSATGGLVQGLIANGHGLDRIVGNGTLLLNTHLTMQVFAVGVPSFTVPAGVTVLHIRIWGASGGNGGGGGGGSGDGAFVGGAGGRGGRGGAGGYGEMMMAVVPGTLFTMTIGTGGTAGPGGVGIAASVGAPGTAGGTGTSTSFPGAFACAGGAGGAGGGGGAPGLGATGVSASDADDGLPGTSDSSGVIIVGGGNSTAHAKALGGAGSLATGATGATGPAGTGGVITVSY